jgi:glycosyltransferase involved in cell wall biosynthesis
MTISAALIVKNEERTLGRCLASLDGAVDEIVVVDTGSNDGTMAIAHQHKARVFHFPWRDDFAAARQYAFDQASSDWVFWLDADDVVIGADRIRGVTASAPPEVGGFYWRYILWRDERGEPTHTCWRERCVRNDGSFRWTGRVHEVLVTSQPRSLVKTGEIVVEHRPEVDRADRPDRAHRNLRILEEHCAASNGTPEPRFLFYLGREYADVGDLPRAIETLQRYLAVGHWDDERYVAQVQIADLHRRQGEYTRALDAGLAALKIRPRWPDAYFGLAATYYFLREWEKVVHWTTIGRSLPVPDTLLFVNTRGYELDWIIYYTNAAYHLGQTAEALAWTRHALALAPADPWHLHNLTFLTAALGEPASS